ncbi:MAG TPA: hypothetical protein DCF33_13530, partial [Saprospirales bacterium]|nr:hypothetical protein [Saprospirales bacterium]
MTKPNTVLIRIRPLEYYFFGGENTFGNGEGANYYAKSNDLPQQTTILGLLRRLLFEAKQPIGQSFRPDVPAQQAYGAIKSLSPVFLLNSEGTGWLPHALGAHSTPSDKNGSPSPTAFQFSSSKGLGTCYTGLGANPGWSTAPYFERAVAKK